jgi:hypothetical protein
MIRLAGIHHACDLPPGFLHQLEFMEKWDKLMVLELDQPSTKYAKGDLHFDALNGKVAKTLQEEITTSASKAAQQAGGSSGASSAGRKRGAETPSQPAYSLPGPMYTAPLPPQGFQQPYLPPPQQHGYQQGFQPRREIGKGFRAGGGGGQRPQGVARGLDCLRKAQSCAALGYLPRGQLAHGTRCGPLVIRPCVGRDPSH